MKIFGIGSNYADHAAEMGGAVPSEPVVFLMADTALTRGDRGPIDFYFPEFTKEIHYEVELVLRIGKEGKGIDTQFARRYIDAVAVGIDFTARDLQNEAKAKGKPWAIAKGFNGAAPVSAFVPIEEAGEWGKWRISLDQNGDRQQEGAATGMIFPVEAIVAYVSKFFHLKIGDLIFTGTPQGVGPIAIGDKLEASLNDTPLLHVAVK